MMTLGGGQYHSFHVYREQWHSIVENGKLLKFKISQNQCMEIGNETQKMFKQFLLKIFGSRSFDQDKIWRDVRNVHHIGFSIYLLILIDNLYINSTYELIYYVFLLDKINQELNF